MAKKQTIIKKPVGNGNISITIENNLKNTNPAPPPIPKKRRRRRPTTDTTDGTNSKIQDMLRGGGGGGGAGIPLKDVSYIKRPSDNLTVWWNQMDSFNTTVPMLNAPPAIPEGQARQMGLLLPPPIIPPAPPAPPVQLTLPAPPVQLALPAPPVDNQLRDFLMYMAAQQGRGRGSIRQNPFNNLHDDTADDEPMDNRYPITASNKIQEIDENVLKAAGVSEEQITKIKAEYNKSAAKGAGTRQGNAGREPYGPFIDTTEFKTSYALAINNFNRIKQQQSVQNDFEPLLPNEAGVGARTRAGGAARGAGPSPSKKLPLDPGSTPGAATDLTSAFNSFVMELGAGLGFPSPQKAAASKAPGPPPPPPPKSPPVGGKPPITSGASWDDVLAELQSKQQSMLDKAKEKEKKKKK